jgi:hypothetical protein
MHKEVRELVEKAATIGWSCDGKIDGRGHYTLVHENGEHYPIAATPSDPRSAKNAIANLERIAGRKTNRVVRNRSRKKVEMYADTRPLTAKAIEKAERQRLAAERAADRQAKREELLTALARRERELTDIRRLMGGR